MRLRTVVFGTVGLLATAVAVSLTFVPTVAGESLVAVLGAVDPTTALLIGSLVVGVCAAVVGWFGGRSSGESPTAFDVAVDSPPEAVTATERRLFAADTDTAIEDAVTGGDAEMEALTERLATAAASAIGTDESSEAAQRAVRAGTWTDDPVAAALLSPTKAQPLSARVRLWLDPESERRRRIRRTIAAIERASGGGR